MKYDSFVPYIIPEFFWKKKTCPSTSSKLENQAVSGAASDLSTEFLGAAEGKDAKLLVQ